MRRCNYICPLYFDSFFMLVADLSLDNNIEKWQNLNNHRVSSFGGGGCSVNMQILHVHGQHHNRESSYRRNGKACPVFSSEFGEKKLGFAKTNKANKKVSLTR